ncbi:MAG TPA: hypothetical protein VFF33_08135 [Ignavibacteriaceae bacterium]|nr:hypothetical protein [Ignavibacteriaceae bacterium]
MGHIFNHNITTDEVQKLKRMMIRKLIEDISEYETKMSSDLINADLYRLYTIRGKKNIAQQYLNRIDDEILRYLLKQ